MVLLKIKMCNFKLCKNVVYKKILYLMGIKKFYILKVGGMFWGEGKEKLKLEISYFV